MECASETDRALRVTGFFEAWEIGGAERVFLSLLSGLARSGWPVEVLAGGPNLQESLVQEWASGLVITPVSWKKRSDVSWPALWPRLAQAERKDFQNRLRLSRPDVILINQPGPQDARLALRHALDPTGIPVVPFIHMISTRLISLRLKPFRIWTTQRALCRAAKILTCSQASAKALVEEYRIPEAQVRVSWNGVPDVGAPLRPEERGRVRQSMGISETDVMVLWAGRFAPEKRVDRILDCASSLRDHPEVRFILAGDGPLRESLEQAHQDLISSRRIQCVGWQKNLDPLLQACDLVVLPSRMESCPLFLLEAASAGKPAVATRCHGIPEVVLHQETGLLVDPEDPKGLRSSVLKLSQDRPLRERLGRASREHYKKYFTLDKAVARLKDVLAEATRPEAMRNFGESAKAHSIRNPQSAIRNGPPGSGKPGWVSVLVVTYNRAHLLEETLESILRQTYPLLECVVVDDGSTDDTPGLMNRLVAQWGSEKIRGFRQANQGMRAARDKAFLESRGEFVQIMDSDDLLTPDKIAEHVAILQSDPSLAGVYGDVVYFSDGPSGRDKLWTFSRYGHDLLALALERPLACHHAFLYRREALEEVFPLGPERLHMDDWDLSLRMLVRGQQLSHVAGEGAWYRLHLTDSISEDRIGLHRGGLQVLDRARCAMEDQGLLPTYARPLAKGIFNMARGLCCAGKRREGAACLARIWRLSGAWGVVATGYFAFSLVIPPKAVEKTLRSIRRSLGARNAVPEGPVTGM